MKSKSLTELESILELKFHKKQQSFAHILANEGRLRGQLLKLNEQERASDAQKDHNLQAIGADVLWKAWVERTKRSLNLELAHVLAQKDALQGAVKREYGKLLVGRELLRLQSETDKTAVRRQFLEKAIEGHFQNSSKKSCL